MLKVIKNMAIQAFGGHTSPASRTFNLTYSLAMFENAMEVFKNTASAEQQKNQISRVVTFLIDYLRNSPAVTDEEAQKAIERIFKDFVLSADSATLNIYLFPMYRNLPDKFLLNSIEAIKAANKLTPELIKNISENIAPNLLPETSTALKKIIGVLPTPSTPIVPPPAPGPAVSPDDVQKLVDILRGIAIPPAAPTPTPAADLPRLGALLEKLNYQLELLQALLLSLRR
jgi:hypothetical protein